MKNAARRFTQFAALAILPFLTAGLVGCASSDTHSASAKPYTLEKCIVSDDAFDHGKPVVMVHQGQQVKFCCEDCQKDFVKDPDKFLKKLAKSK